MNRSPCFHPNCMAGSSKSFCRQRAIRSSSSGMPSCLTAPLQTVDGVEIMESILDSADVERLRRAVGNLPRLRRGGARNLLGQSKSIADLAKMGPIKAVADAALGAGCFAVRATYFDKLPAANWNVSWHQDITIAVAGRIETPGFTGWSTKDKVPHVQPPTDILESMVALRIHLGDCGPDNGPLRVLPGSHRHGKLSSDEIICWRGRIHERAFPNWVRNRGAPISRSACLPSILGTRLSGDRRSVSWRRRPKSLVVARPATCW